MKVEKQQELKAIIIDGDVDEVSLVDHGAVQKTYIAVKSLQGGSKMSVKTEAGNTPDKDKAVETPVQKAMEETKKIIAEKGEAMKMIIDKIVAGTASEDEYDILYGLSWDFAREAWVVNVAAESGTVEKADNFPVEKPTAKKLDRTETETEDKDAEKKQEETMEPDKKDAKKSDDSEKKDAEKKQPETEEEKAEKAALEARIEDLKAQKAKLDGAIDVLTEKEEKEDSEKGPVEKQLSDLESEVAESQKRLDDLLKTRGASKAAGADNGADEEEQRKKSAHPFKGYFDK